MRLAACLPLSRDDEATKWRQLRLQTVYLCLNGLGLLCSKRLRLVFRLWRSSKLRRQAEERLLYTENKSFILFVAEERTKESQMTGELIYCTVSLKARMGLCYALAAYKGSLATIAGFGINLLYNKTINRREN